MSIGQITLDGIAVNVSTTLNGLKGLKNSTTIDSVDVAGGTSSAIELDLQGKYIISCLIKFAFDNSLDSHNLEPFQFGIIDGGFEYVPIVSKNRRPSQLFTALQLSRDNVILGTTLLPNLTLIRGNNTLNATSNFDVSVHQFGTFYSFKKF